MTNKCEDLINQFYKTKDDLTHWIKIKNEMNPPLHFCQNYLFSQNQKLKIRVTGLLNGKISDILNIWKDVKEFLLLF